MRTRGTRRVLARARGDSRRRRFGGGRRSEPQQRTCGRTAAPQHGRTAALRALMKVQCVPATSRARRTSPPWSSPTPATPARRRREPVRPGGDDADRCAAASGVRAEDSGATVAARDSSPSAPRRAGASRHGGAAQRARLRAKVSPLDRAAGGCLVEGRRRVLVPLAAAGGPGPRASTSRIRRCEARDRRARRRRSPRGRARPARGPCSRPRRPRRAPASTRPPVLSGGPSRPAPPDATRASGGGDAFAPCPAPRPGASHAFAMRSPASGRVDARVDLRQRGLARKRRRASPRSSTRAHRLRRSSRTRFSGARPCCGRAAARAPGRRGDSRDAHARSARAPRAVLRSAPNQISRDARAAARPSVAMGVTCASASGGDTGAGGGGGGGGRGAWRLGAAVVLGGAPRPRLGLARWRAPPPGFRPRRRAVSSRASRRTSCAPPRPALPRGVRGGVRAALGARLASWPPRRSDPRGTAPASSTSTRAASPPLIVNPRETVPRARGSASAASRCAGA